MPFFKGFRRHFGPILPILPIGAGIFAAAAGSHCQPGRFDQQRCSISAGERGAACQRPGDSFTVRTLDRRGLSAGGAGDASAAGFRFAGVPLSDCFTSTGSPGFRVRGGIRGKSARPALSLPADQFREDASGLDRRPKKSARLSPSRSLQKINIPFLKVRYMCPPSNGAA